MMKRTVTYNEPETVYIPSTPIRETPEGQMMMAAVDAMGYAVGSLISDGLSAGLVLDLPLREGYRSQKSLTAKSGWKSISLLLTSKRR